MPWPMKRERARRSNKRRVQMETSEKTRAPENRREKSFLDFFCLANSKSEELFPGEVCWNYANTVDKATENCDMDYLEAFTESDANEICWGIVEECQLKKIRFFNLVELTELVKLLTSKTYFGCEYSRIFYRMNQKNSNWILIRCWNFEKLVRSNKFAS